MLSHTAAPNRESRMVAQKHSPAKTSDSHMIPRQISAAVEKIRTHSCSSSLFIIDIEKTRSQIEKEMQLVSPMSHTKN